MKFKKTKKVKSPHYASEGSAAILFYVPDNFPQGEDFVGEHYMANTQRVELNIGISAELKPNETLLFKASPNATRAGFYVESRVNVDSLFNGAEIALDVTYIGDEIGTLKPGLCIASAIIVKTDSPELEIVESV